MPKLIRFFHLDDEVVRISWIPSALRTFYFQKFRHLYPQSTPLQEPTKGGDMIWTFILPSETEEKAFDVRYQIFDRQEKLLALPNDELQDSVIILDLMGPGSDRQDKRLSGVVVLDELKNKCVSVDHILMLTAFGASARIEIDENFSKNILEKPIDARSLSKRLLVVSGVLDDVE